MRERLRQLCVVVLAAGAVGMTPGLERAAAQNSGLPDPVAATIARGRYLTLLGDCAACHTDSHRQTAFSGGRPIETPLGNVLASNITPDRQTGIGNLSDAEFDARSVRGYGRTASVCIRRCRFLTTRE